MARKFQIKRGLKANLPTLAQGEFAMTTDSGAEALWLGAGNKNKKIPLDPTAADVGAVAKDGSNAMTGDLKISKTSPRVFLLDSATTTDVRLTNILKAFVAQVKAAEDESVYRQLRLYDTTGVASLANALQLLSNESGSLKAYNVLSTASKPIGSYTGNGDATSRTIDTGGIGYVLFVWSTKGWAIVAQNAAITFSATGAVAVGIATFNAGTLTVSTVSDMLNANGVTYHYQCL